MIIHIWALVSAFLLICATVGFFSADMEYGILPDAGFWGGALWAALWISSVSATALLIGYGFGAFP